MTPRTTAHQASRYFTISQRVLKLGVQTGPLSQWCHPIISSSVAPSSFCSHSFSASGSFPVSQLFTSGGQNIGVSASVSVLPMNIQGWFLLGLLSNGLSSLFQHHNAKASILWCFSLWSNSIIHTWLLEKTHSFDYMDLCRQNDVSAFEYAV